MRVHGRLGPIPDSVPLTGEDTEALLREMLTDPERLREFAAENRAMVAGTMKGIISQRLVPTPDGTGRVAVCEILTMTGRARDMISDPEQTGRLAEVIAEGEYYGMQTFDQALLGHLNAGRVDMEQALKAASSPHDFKLLVAAQGRRSTSMSDIAAGAAGRSPSPDGPPGGSRPPASVVPQLR